MRTAKKPKANARLATAAPEPLEVLRFAMPAISTAADTNPAAYGWVEKAAREAIAKVAHKK